MGGRRLVHLLFFLQQRQAHGYCGQESFLKLRAGGSGGGTGEGEVTRYRAWPQSYDVSSYIALPRRATVCVLVVEVGGGGGGREGRYMSSIAAADPATACLRCVGYGTTGFGKASLGEWM